MADDHKRTEVISLKVTEKMALDLLRLSAAHDRSMSDFLYRALRQRLYGDIVQLETLAAQITSSDHVNEHQ